MKNLTILIMLLSLMSNLLSLELPETKIIPDTIFIHDRMLIDNYAWLKDKTRKDQEVLQFLQKENDITQQFMKDTENLQNLLYDEYISRLARDESSVPVKIDNYFYYNRIEADKDYKIHCRRKNEPDASEEIYLDENELAQDYDFFHLYELEISPDHNLLAYTIDTTGFENYSLYIKDLRQNNIIETFHIPIDDVVWTEDNETIFYSTIDSTGRSNKVYRHKLNSAQPDELVFHEPDGAFYLWLNKSRSKNYIYLISSSKTTSEVWFLPTRTPDQTFQVIQKRQPGREYYVEDYHKIFYIRTNADSAHNFKIMIAPVSDPKIENWQEFIAHRDSVYLQFAVFENFLVQIERKKGTKSIRFTDHHKTWEQEITFAEKPYALFAGVNPDYFTNVYVYQYESLLTPLSTFEFDLASGTSKLLKRKKINNYDPNNYDSTIMFATASDGTIIPVSLVYRKDQISPDGNPLILYGYGSYGDPQDPYFSNSRVSLLDRGIISATVHVRGGGEFGFDWYKAGKKENKINTFTDFISATEFLISENITTSDQLVIHGASAGGLLIGAVLNMRPDLFRGAVAEVPFVDVINTMLDSSLSATVSEYDEWGNPNLKTEFDYIYSYCPYQNVSVQNYPDILAIAGFYDQRVNYWEPAKWISRIRELKTDNNRQLLFTFMNSGHSGSSGIHSYYRETAFIHVYILKLFGIYE